MRKENKIFAVMLFIGAIYGLAIMLIEIILPKILVDIILGLFVLITIFRLIKNKNKQKEIFDKLKNSIKKSKINLSIQQSIIATFICLWLGSIIPLLISNSNYIDFITAYFLFVGTVMYFKISRLL